MAIIEPQCNAVEQLVITPELLNSPLGRTFSFVQSNATRTRQCAPPLSTDIAVIGGGPVGFGIACHLWHQPRLRAGMVLLDAAEHVLEGFFNTMRSLGQRVMRSPYQHQLAPDGDIQLIDYARLHRTLLTASETAQLELALTGQRAVVPMDLFIAHSLHVAAVHQINRFAYRFNVHSIQPISGNGENGWRIEDESGRALHVRAVIIATGSKRRALPAPLQTSCADLSKRIQSAYTRLPSAKPHERVAVVGGGLSAGHLLLSLVRQGAFPIWILRREELYRCADVNTAYFRTEGITRFRAGSLPARHTVLCKELRGSLMLEFIPLLQAYENEGRMDVYRRCEIAAIEEGAAGSIHATLTSGSSIEADRIIVANGFEPDTGILPDGTDLVGGYPIAEDTTLEVAGFSNLFVAGALASMTLGPAARNIDGARLASEMLLPTLIDRFSPHARSGTEQMARIKGTRAINIPNYITAEEMI